MKNKTIIIKGSNEIFFNDLKNVYTYYRTNIVLRIIKKIVTKLKMSFAKQLFYGRWKKELEKYDCAVLFDSEYHDDIALYIKKKNPNIKIIFWYWNSIKSHGGKLINTKYIDEVWTYDRFDAKKYNIKYNPQFYHKLPISSKKIETNSLFFLGKDKGRKAIIDKLAASASEQGVNFIFRIVKGRFDAVSYREYLNLMNNSKCIVDLVYNSPCGLTLRPLEALFYNKKLITNNVDIVNYDFYNKHNIFILGKDDINGLAEFVNSPSETVNSEIIDYYSYEKWLERIINNEVKNV